MQQFPNLAADQKKVCAGCRLWVSRDDCHRNRYNEYICKSCQAKGLRFTWNNRLRNYARRSAVTLSVVTVSAAIGMFILWIFYSVIMRLDIFKLVFE